MSLLRRLLVVSLSTLAVLATTVLGSSAAFARVDHDGVYSLPYSDGLVYSSRGCNCFYDMSYEDWAGRGFPTPRRSDTDFVKYPWSATIYAVTFFGPEPSDWKWDSISFAEWTRAGRPAARNAGWIEGSYFYKYELNDDIYVRAPDGSEHALTGRQWADAGYPSPDVIYNAGYVKLAWGGDIILLSDASQGIGHPISYGEWRDKGFPGPRTVNRLPNDEVFRYSWASDVYYRGGGVWRKITGAEWHRMGSPAPRVY